MKISSKELAKSEPEATPMRQFRDDLDGMSLTELAGLTGEDLSLLSRIDTGKRKPTIRVAMKISRALGKPVHIVFPDLIAE